MTYFNFKIKLKQKFKNLEMLRATKPLISLVPSTKGKDMLNVNNFLFYKRNQRPNGDIYWKCQNEIKSFTVGTKRKCTTAAIYF